MVQVDLQVTVEYTIKSTVLEEEKKRKPDSRLFKEDEIISSRQVPRRRVALSLLDYSYTLV